MTDEPLVPLATSGKYTANVVDLAGVRLRCGAPKDTLVAACAHKDLIYDQKDRRIWCCSCEKSIDNFDAVMLLVSYFNRMTGDLARRQHAVDTTMNSSLNRRAAKAIDRAWSGKSMAVACPHCRYGILPEDFERGVPLMTSREIEIQRRKTQADSQKAGLAEVGFKDK